MSGFVASWASWVPLALCETLSFLLYARLVSAPRGGLARTAGCAAAAALAYAAVIAFSPWEDDHSLPFVLCWLAVLWGLLLSARRLSARQALYNGLVIVLSTHFLRHLFGNALILIGGGIWFRRPGQPELYLAGCLGVLALFSASLLAMGKLAPRDEESEAESLPFIGVVAVLLVLINSYSVKMLRRTYGGEGFTSFLTALSTEELLLDAGGERGRRDEPHVPLGPRAS